MFLRSLLNFIISLMGGPLLMKICGRKEFCIKKDRTLKIVVLGNRHGDAQPHILHTH